MINCTTNAGERLRPEENNKLNYTRFVFICSQTNILALDIAPSHKSIPEFKFFNIKDLVTDDLLDKWAKAIEDAREYSYPKLREATQLPIVGVRRTIYSYFRNARPEIDTFPPPYLFELEDLHLFELSLQMAKIQELIQERGGSTAIYKFIGMYQELKESRPASSTSWDKEIINMVQGKSPMPILWKNPDLEPN